MEPIVRFGGLWKDWITDTGSMASFYRKMSKTNYYQKNHCAIAMRMLKK